MQGSFFEVVPPPSITTPANGGVLAEQSPVMRWDMKDYSVSHEYYLFQGQKVKTYNYRWAIVEGTNFNTANAVWNVDWAANYNELQNPQCVKDLYHEDGSVFTKGWVCSGGTLIPQYVLAKLRSGQQYSLLVQSNNGYESSAYAVSTFVYQGAYVTPNTQYNQYNPYTPYVPGAVVPYATQTGVLSNVSPLQNTIVTSLAGSTRFQWNSPVSYNAAPASPYPLVEYQVCFDHLKLSCYLSDNNGKSSTLTFTQAKWKKLLRDSGIQTAPVPMVFNWYVQGLYGTNRQVLQVIRSTPWAVSYTQNPAQAYTPVRY